MGRGSLIRDGWPMWGPWSMRALHAQAWADSARGGGAGAGELKDGPASREPDEVKTRERTRRKRTLGALALALCATAVAVGTGADFTAETANPSNTFSAGSLSMDNSKNGAAIFAPTNMKPGGPAQTGIVDIKNTGTIDGVFSLTRDQLTNTDHGADNPGPFAAKVVIGIADCGTYTTADGPYGPEAVTPTCGDADDRTLYLGSLSNQNQPVALGTYHPDEQHRYQFSAALDSSAENEYATDSSSARYVFDAVQTP